ncbi:RNA polymerase sigma factor [Archangium lipolyticum]|uniref:RNA polymerase sigma factor n=1 Tax=Archangium lipolyticum TaxID=2970465 RepID=UPI00214A6D62|nr:sigma-70 family RNA polymerase sigma factor [Archangium lipolyticum]
MVWWRRNTAVAHAPESARAEPLRVEELYRRFGPAVRRRALSLVHDEEEALDITQDTFLAFVKDPALLRGEASAFTVLYQIATFKSVDRVRRRARWSGRLGGLVVNEEGEPVEREPEASGGGLEQVEAAQDLALLTHGEEPRTLTAALLYFVEGYNMEEVGQVLGLTRKTVGRLLEDFATRARKRSARFEDGRAA